VTSSAVSIMIGWLNSVLGRPVFNTTTQLVVLFGVSLIQIIDLDEKGQILTVNVWNTYVRLLSYQYTNNNSN
jgi:hypothetical protein